MGRTRASIQGGYVRKTVSLPASLMKRLEHELKVRSGLTLSALLTEAGEAYLKNGKVRV